MKLLFSILSIVLYFIVGIISFLMAYKALFANKFLPFHEEATGTYWDYLDRRLQYVILTILRISGLGFLVVAFLLTTFPIVNYFKPNSFIRYAIPVLSLVYCFGLFLFNYSLHKKTKTHTPWKGSLIAIFIIFIGLVLSLI